MNKNSKKKISVATILTLILSISSILTAIPNASATTIISYPYIIAAPNPVGVGQTVAVVFWIDSALPGATVTNDIRRHDYSLTITAPDKTVETQTWNVVSDSTSVQYYQFTPEQVGNYTIEFKYPQQTYNWNSSTTPGANNGYIGAIFTGANKTITLVVQEEAIPSAKDSYPLPTEYWVRPIEGENSYWYSIASNWLGTPYIIGAGASYGLPGAVQPDGAAPNSAHVMWTKEIQFGGVVGGNNTAVPAEMWYSGLSYNIRFGNPIIIQGRLFYQEPWGNAGGSGGLFGAGGDYVAVDLQTGEELWRINPAATGVMLVPTFGYLYSYEDPNQHGVLSNGLLIAPSTYSAFGGPTSGYPGLGTVWRMYEPRTGVLTTMNITNVPSGTPAKGPSGEYLIYSVSNLGTTTNPNWTLSQWNSSRVFGGAGMMGISNWYSGTANASLPSAFDYQNIPVPSLKGTGWAVGTASLSNTVPLVNPGDKLLLVQGGFGNHPQDYGAAGDALNPSPANITAISLNPNSYGSVLWTKTYDPAPNNNSRIISDWDPVNNVFVFIDKEDMVHYGYSLTTGEKVWGPTKLTDDYTVDYQYMTLGLERIAYGKLYFTGYSGILFCYDTKTGDLLWTYGNGGEGNSTLSGFETPYGRYPTFLTTIADGKVYMSTSEHSPNSPLYKDAQYRCVNATDGTEIWTILGYGNQMYGGQMPIADGYLTTLNSYDARIYCFGKGPSQLSVTAPDLAATVDQPVIIRGTITDIASGTQQTEQAGRFPNGVPVVSDASMGNWMEYVYMQKPRPANVTGVPVSVDVVDANGNYRNIGTAMSSANGVFSLTWTPDIEGTYNVIATFAGTNSYYPSYAETSFAVYSTQATATPTIAGTTSAADMYLLPGIIAIIVVIIIVGAILALLMLRKRP